VASNLEPLVLADPGAPLIKEIGNLRNNLTTHLGFLLPPVKFHGIREKMAPKDI
jgi:flagellar biosynthesis component FlhA